RSVAPDERRRVAIADERVVGDPVHGEECLGSRRLDRQWRGVDMTGSWSYDLGVRPMRQEVLDKARDDPYGTPARLLDAAEQVFAEGGYAGAATREIARRAGVPFGALHYHWGSKRQLWEAVFKRLGERTRDTLMRNLVPGRTPGETLDNLTDAF